MLHHHVAVMDKFLDEQPAGDPQSGKDSQHANGAEKVQRTAKVLQQEANGDEVKKTPKVREIP